MIEAYRQLKRILKLNQASLVFCIFKTDAKKPQNIINIISMVKSFKLPQLTLIPVFQSSSLCIRMMKLEFLISLYLMLILMASQIILAKIEFGHS